MSDEREQDSYWERLPYVVSEFKIDARWILRKYDDPNDPPKAWGSLRIVSHPDLPPGHLKAVASFVTGRKPKTQEEIQKSIEEYQMEEIELEVYSVDDHVSTQDMEHVGTKREIEDLFGVKIFE